MPALYLKYRPQTLGDLIGQNLVKKTLLSSFQADKLSHAYLFVGPRGTGKTSTARILAKMVNCERVMSDELLVQGKNAPNSEPITHNIPCNQCSTCLSITNGSNLDLIEIDAASNRGIDDIRSLRDTIKLATSGSNKKVYIIDEVHMLTTEAFNALLKTLEEPPAHVIFILATTEINKIPQTILSRVQRLDFKLATSPDLMLALQKVADGEKIKIDQEALKIIAQKADGSFRDGVKLLDQIQSNEDLSVDAITQLLGTSSFNETLALLESIQQKQAKKALEWVLNQENNGSNIKSTMLNLMDILRSMVLLKNGLVDLVKEDYGSGKFESLKELTEKFGMADLVRCLEVLQKGLENLKTASIVGLPLELAAVEMCSPVIPATAGIQLNHLADDQKNVSRGPAGSVSRRASSVIDIPSGYAPGPSSPSPLETTSPEVAAITVGSESKQDDQVSPDIAKLHEKWTYVLETVKSYNYSLEALLRNIKITKCEDGLVVLEVPYSFHQRILEAPKSRDLLESVFSEVLGKPVRVSTAIGVRPQRLEDIANVEIAAEDEIVSLASEIFNGKLVD